MKITLGDFVVNIDLLEDRLRAFRKHPDDALRVLLTELSISLYDAAEAQNAKGLLGTASETMKMVTGLWEAIDSLPNPYEDAAS